ncbi:MAG: tetratricopeptide repeat protein [Bacteroidota bacterium]
MLRFFPIVLILQGYCLYDAFKNHREQRWLWIIVILPLIGSIIYLYTYKFKGGSFSSKKFQMQVVKGSSKMSLSKMEKEVKYSETFSNLTSLGELYFHANRLEDAKRTFERALDKYDPQDAEVNTKLVLIYHRLGNHESAAKAGKIANGNKRFDNSESKIAFAWSLHELDRNEEALKAFEEMDGPFINYDGRIEYCRLLNKLGKKDKAFEKMNEMLEEIDRMAGREKRQNNWVKGALKRLFSEISA